MMASTTWCSPCLVVLPHHPKFAAWRRAIGLLYTVAEPDEWSTGPALHNSYLSTHLAGIDYVTCLHVLQASDSPDVRCPENVHACFGNRRA
jgi:hypothetical protein